MKQIFTFHRVASAFAAFTLTFFISCKKEINSPALSPSESVKLGEVILPSNFKFSTYSKVDFDFKCIPKTTFKIIGKYRNEEEVLGTFFFKD